MDIEPKPGETFSIFREKQMSIGDDTMDLLQEAGMQNPKLEVEKGDVFSMAEKKTAQKFNTENTGGCEEINLHNKNEVITVFKGNSAQLMFTSDNQVSVYRFELSSPAAAVVFLYICFIYILHRTN